MLMIRSFMDTQAHWEQVYRTKSPLEMSWYQHRPEMSLRMIDAAAVPLDASIIDVGGGASVLVDHLLDCGFANVTVLDISAQALEHAKARLAERAASVRWVVADALDFDAPQPFAIWHDRAVFHFLTDPADRRRYGQSLHRHLLPGGQAIIATFAPDGPPRCSGLEVMRHDAKSVEQHFCDGGGFELLDTADETHITPWNAPQRFAWFRLRRQPLAA